MRNSGVVVGALVALAASPAFSQTSPQSAAQVPPEPAALSSAEKQRDANVDLRDVAALRAELADLEKNAPQEALLRYRNFLVEKPDLKPQAAVVVIDAIAQLQFNRLRDLEAALKTYDAALETYKAEPSSLSLLTEESKMLIASGRAGEAETRVRARWPQLFAAAPTISSPLLQQLARALTQQGKKDELVLTLQEVLVQVPVFLDDGTQSRPRREQSLDAFLLSGTGWGWMYEQLVETLLEQNRVDEALSWAKVRYMSSQASSGAVDRATRMLARVAMAKDPSGAFAWSLSQAQQNGKTVTQASDLLAAVPLPKSIQSTADPEISERAATGAGARDRMNLLLLRGPLRTAMIEACRSMDKRLDRPYGAMDVARVFKAADLNVRRANLWLEFARTGGGDNPLPAFFGEQMPPEAEAAIKRAGTTPTLKALQSMDEFASIVPFKVSLLRAKKLSPAAAWHSGIISAEEVGYMLRWGGIVDGEGQTENKKLRVSLAGLLATEEPLLVEPSPDNQNIRLAVADFYRERKDRQAEAMLRQMLQEGEAKPGQGGQPMRRAWYYEPALNRLAAFYREVGEAGKASALFEQEERATQGRDEIASSVAALEVARLALLTGDTDKAQELYTRVANGGYGWTAGLALWDQANALIEKGDHEAARRLLQQPVTGEGADKARVGLESLLALSYYRTGEVEASRKAAQAALDAFKVSDARQGRGVVEQAQSARELLGRLDGWQRQPIQPEPRELRFSPEATAQVMGLAAFEGDWLIRRLRIRTLTAEPLQVMSDNQAVQVLLLDEVGQEPFAVVRQVQISLRRSALAQGLKANIVISSAQHPETPTTVLVRSEGDKPLPQ